MSRFTPPTIHEGVAGYYVYHIAIDDVPLCGFKRFCSKNGGTMRTEVPVRAWGTVTHLNEKYCDLCARVAHEKGLLNE